jgi:hypothetical protein
MMFIHKTQPVFDEVPFLGCKQFVPVINRPEFEDKATQRISQMHTNWAFHA